MIASCRIDVSVLAPTFEEYPDLSIDVEGLHAGRSVPLRSVFWARNVESDVLDGAFSVDQTVEDVSRFTTTADATLYRSLHPPDLPTTTVYNAALEHDVHLLSATNDGHGWDVRLQVPERSTFASFVERCQSIGVDVEVTALRDREDVTGNGFGLTNPQREIITLARDRGYFSIPREVSLSDLATELGISRQAASERLRRGVSMLVSNTVCECDSTADDNEVR